tara:strand:+ start:44916 stop:46091 length:1176 start_codon:yes stop_codon:yes gene_type:complete
MKFTIVIFLLLVITKSPNNDDSHTIKDTNELPFELIKEKVIVPVEINGKSYKFLLDTGGIFEISQGLQNEFNFDKTSTTTIIDINRNEIELNTVVVPEIKLGNWTFSNRKAIVSDLPHKYPYSCFDLDGMIGRDFFDDVILQFDHASGTFRMTDDIKALSFDKANRTKLKFSKRGLPEFKVTIDGKSEFIEFDSGSGDLYSPKTEEVEKRQVRNGNTKLLEFEGQFSFGVTMDDIKNSTRYMEKIERLEIANTTFNNFYSQFSKASAPRIGAAILKYGKLTLDYKSGWFYFSPYSKSPKMVRYETFGFDIAIIDGNYVVKYVLVDSEAEKLGLRPGSKILMINNFSTKERNFDCEGYLNGYSFNDKPTIEIMFLDISEEEKTIILHKTAHN